MHSALLASSSPDLAAENPEIHVDDLSIGIAADALLACHARNADSKMLLAMCERLLTVTEGLMLERERKMMASGDPNLAIQVRRHGDVLLILSQQVRALRRGAATLNTPFIHFVTSLAGRFRPDRSEAA